MLSGTYPAKLPVNHRTSLPAPLRRELGENIVIAKWYEECLVLVAKSSWNALLKRITGEEKLITAPVRGSEHFIFSLAYEIVPDEQGRIVVPERLIEYAGLGEDVYFLGIGDRVEIWNKEVWDEKEKVIAKEASQYIEEISKR